MPAIRTTSTSCSTDAFLHGRLHLVDPPAFLEIARFGDEAFVIDPPAPTLFLLPFTAIFGTGVDHVLVSCGVGALAIGSSGSPRDAWPDDVRFGVAMTVLVALGTNFWWLASDGGFWSFAHVARCSSLSAALAEAVGTKRPWLVGTLVGLAGLSRLSVFLIAPLFLWLVLDGDLKITARNSRQDVLVRRLRREPPGSCTSRTTRCATGRSPTWGTTTRSTCDEPWFDRGRFDITYIPRHLRAIFYELPVFGGGFPWMRPKFVGTALFFTTPAFLYAFRAKLTSRNVAAIVSLLLVCCVLLTHGAVGFSQFGYRFAMDVLPCLMLLTASGMRERLTKPGMVLIGTSVLMNLWGMLAFNHFGWATSG